MFRLFLLLSTSVVLFLGCSNTSPSMHKQHKSIAKTHKMFQTVAEDEATLIQKGQDKLHCTRCGMNLVMFYKTSHTAQADGKNYQYCSMHCLAEHLKSGADIKNFKVVDVHSLKLIPVSQAYYVVGSDVRGTMSRVSKYAFKSLSDAKAFQAKHGGKIVDFKTALEIAKKDFK